MCLHLLFQAGLNWFNCHLKTNWYLKNRLQRLLFRSAKQNASRKIVHTDIELSHKTSKKWDVRNHRNGDRVVKQVMLASYFPGHSYFLNECPDTPLKFSGFKLHYRQERQECQQSWNNLYLMTLWDTNLSRIFARTSDISLTFLWVWPWYNIIPGSPSMLRVTSIGSKGNLRQNTTLSSQYQNSDEFYSFPPQTGIKQHKIHAWNVPTDKNPWNSIKCATLPSHCDKNS